MKTLIFKEWKQLAAIGWLWAGLIVMGFISLVLTRRIDEESYRAMCDSYCYPGADLNVGIILTILLLITAYSLYPREFDDSTIDFLHALPVSRLKIFIGKILAAWSLVAILILFAYAIDAAMLAFNTESISGVFYAQIHLSFMLRELVFAFIILSHGVFLSCFRTQGLILYGIYIFSLIYLEQRYGNTGIANVFNVLWNEYHGSRLLFEWRAITVHTLVAVVLLAISYCIWSRKETTGNRSRTGSLWVLWIGRIGGLLGFLALTAFTLQQIGVRSGSTSSVGTASQGTEHYRFVFPEGVETTADFLIEHADQDYQQLVTMLNTEARPYIDADMTAENDHIPGLAKWKKIRMDLSGFYSDQMYRRILSHETAHVLQGVVGKRALAKNFTATRFFIEGMAQHTSFQIVPDDETRKSNWRLAAIAWKRQNIKFGDLLNNALFTAKFDEELYYSLGDIWTDALVNTCGLDILGNILISAARPDAPVDPSPLVFWRDVLQHNNCELEVVNVNWQRQMKELLENESSREFPKLLDIKFSLDKDAGRVTGIANIELPPDGVVPERFRLKIRSQAILGTRLDDVFPGRLLENQSKLQVTYTFPVSAIANRSRFKFQMGYVPTAGSRGYFEPWQNGSLTEQIQQQ